MVGGNDVSGEKLKLHGNYFPGESISSLSLPPLPLSVSLCVSEEKRFSLKVIQRRGRKKVEIGGLVYWLETDRTGSNKLVEASGRNQRCKWPAGPHKESRIRKEGKVFFFFSVPFFASSRAPLHLERFLIFLLWKREERRECDRVRLARGCGSCIGWTSTFFD